MPDDMPGFPWASCGLQLNRFQTLTSLQTSLKLCTYISFIQFLKEVEDLPQPCLVCQKEPPSSGGTLENGINFLDESGAEAAFFDCNMVLAALARHFTIF